MAGPKEEKLFNITLSGNVQDIGFRNYIVGVAKKRGISVYPWNENGNVRVLYKGPPGTLDDFLSAIKAYELADIEETEVKEIRRLRDVPLPPEAGMVVGGDVFEEIHNKLAVGVHYLKNINGKLNHLSEETRAMGKTLGNKIDAMGEALGNKIDAMGEALGNKIDTMGGRIDASTKEQRKYNETVVQILKELTKKPKKAKKHR